jgi:hypothetical protein
MVEKKRLKSLFFMHLVGERSEVSSFLKEDLDAMKAWNDSF